MRHAILSVLLASGLLGQAPEGHPTQEPAPRHARTGRLGLDQAQKDKLKAIREHHRPALRSKRDAARDARRSLAEAMRNPQTPQADLKRLFDQAADRRFDLMMEMRSLRAEVRDVLTPEQRERAAEWHGRMMERRRHRPG